MSTSIWASAIGPRIRAAIPGAQIEIGPGLDPRGLGPQGYFALDITRARRELGYEPRYTPETAVRDRLEWAHPLAPPAP